MKKIRVFVDTSVFGGCFDDEFRKDSEAFFNLVRKGRFQVVVSELILEELKGAPSDVFDVFFNLPNENKEILIEGEEVFELKDAYIQAGVVTKKSENDASHIAIASIAKVDLIVSWNFKHIVHFEKIRGYNGINIIKGYQSISIHSPSEVIDYEKE
ncbi:MAG: PIN domain-containing protein [Bacteriovoracaceae bacterium]